MTREAPQALVSTIAPPDIGALVRDLRKLYYVKGIELMLRIGELILERLYEGNVARWKSRCRKDYSFRKLQQHPDLPFKASMLSRAVSMYVLSRRSPPLPDVLAATPQPQEHRRRAPLGDGYGERRRIADTRSSRAARHSATTLPTSRTRDAGFGGTRGDA
jgi:hypothetical protein